MEAIILAGGLGTRLRDTVPDLPKCMAPVAGRPFLFYVIRYLRSQGINRFLFSLGYKAEIILDYLEDQFNTLTYDYIIEDEPLGTGGAIKLASALATEKNIVVANGDTLFHADIMQLMEQHLRNAADCSIALKRMYNADRFGQVSTDDHNRITSFKEKQFFEDGLINGGIYCLQVNIPALNSLPERFSFETDYLEKNLVAGKIYGFEEAGFFIDIGIPEDYNRAQTLLSKPLLSLNSVDPGWSLLIDRDGVINHEKKGGYIQNWAEFQFYDQVPSAMAKLARRFKNIIIVSNQRGIGRGLMTEKELAVIHEKMKKEIENAGGRIDGIYYCPADDDKANCRKPNPGMAFAAMREHPSIDPARTIMVGNKLSDMRFARNADIYSVFLATTNPEIPFPHPDIDLRFDSLAHFADSL